MRKRFVIAIDGPGASGKSTTAKLLAKKMKYIYIDTGAMYRACGLCSLENNIDLKDIKALEKMLDNMEIQIKYSQTGNQIFLNGKDISSRIREADITKLSSEIAVIDIVRKKMVELQRQIGKDGGVIMDGRDIGTVVFPNADFKFFMIADVETRALRRWKEAKDKGEKISLNDIEKELVWRDRNDSTRDIAPLKQAEDAIAVDTSDMTIQEQVDFILNVIKKGKRRKIYSFICITLYFFMRVVWRLEIIHKERLESIENCIIAANHISAFDPLFIGAIIPGEIYYLAKAELFKNKLLEKLLKHVNVIPVKRGRIDKGAIRVVNEVLQKGHSIMIFPEGTRKAISVKAGIGKFALQLQKDIRPIFIKNSTDFWKCFSGKRRLQIIIAEKIKAESFSQLEDTKENYRNLASNVMKKILELENEC